VFRSFLDYEFDKVNELTKQNNIARYDLLKIQESALELKMVIFITLYKENLMDKYSV